MGYGWIGRNAARWWLGPTIPKWMDGEEDFGGLLKVEVIDPCEKWLTRSTANGLWLTLAIASWHRGCFVDPMHLRLSLPVADKSS